MPTYDYVCDGCGHEFELFQQMSAPVERTCPECGKDALKRLVGTGGGILFKGSGFYETDYRSDSYRKAADSDQKAASKSDDGSSSSKSDDSKGTSKKSSSDPPGGKSGGDSTSGSGGKAGGASDGG